MKKTAIILLTIALCITTFPVRGFCAQDSFYNENETEMITVGDDEQLDNKLKTPGNVTVTQTGKNTFTLNWDEVLGAVSYDVAVYRNKAYEAAPLTKTVKENSLEITLDEGHIYSFGVRANAYEKSKVHTSSDYSAPSEEFFIPSLRRIEFAMQTLTIAMGADTALPEVICTPAVLDEGVTIQYYSDNNSVATVDYEGVLHGCNAGTTDITAIAVYGGKIIPDIEATITVTVAEEEAAAEIADSLTVCAVTNIDTTIKQALDRSGVNLGNWKLADPSFPIKNYVGTEHIDVPVYFDNTINGNRTYKTITLKPVTYSGIDVKAPDGSELPQKISLGENYSLKPQYVLTGDADSLSLRNDYTVSYTYKCSNSSIRFNSEPDGSMTVSAVKAGSYTIIVACVITASYLSNPLTVATKNIKLEYIDTSLNGIVEDIDNEILINDVPAAADSKGIINIYKTDAVKIKNTISSVKPDGKAYKLTFSSSDATVLKIKSANRNDKTFTDLAVNKSGLAILTVSVDDSYKTRKTYTIRALDNTAAGVYTDVSTLKFNTERSDEVNSVRIYNGLGSKLQNVHMTFPAGSKAKAQIVNFDDDGTVNIAATAAGKIILNATMDGIEGEVQIPLTVAMSVTKPTINVKQIQKYNLFLGSNQPAVYTLTAGNETITGVNLIALMPSGNGQLNDYSYDVQTGILKIYTRLQGNATALISVKGYKGTYQKSIAIATVNESYKLTASTLSIYTQSGDKAAVTGLYDNNSKTTVNLEDKGYSFSYVKKNTASNTNYSVSVDGSNIVIKLLSGDIPKSGEKLSLSLNGTDTTLRYENIKPFDVTVKPADVQKAELSLSTASPVLYSYGNVFNYVKIGVSLKGNGYDSSILSTLTISETTSPAAKKAGDNMIVSYKDGVITAKKNSRNLAAGTYSYLLTVTDPALKNGRSTATLKIRVVDTTKSASANAKVTLRATGSIDVVNRANDYILFTPVFANIPADAKVIKAELAGRDAALFDASLADGKNLKLTLKKDAQSVLINYGYQVYGVYILDTGGCQLTVSSPVMTVKLKQSNVKITVSGNTAFSNMAAGENAIVFSAVGTDNHKVNIKKVVLTDGYSGTFRLKEDSMAGEIIGEMTGAMKICHTPSSYTKRGSGYSLKFAVYPEGAAANAKPQYVTVRYAVIK